jgi:hypothetical protein
MAAPLPAEPIGPAAKWQALTTVKSQGMNIDQTVTHELLSIENDRLLTTNTVAQSAANQKISNPAMPSLKADLTKMTGTGGDNMTYDLGSIMPSQGSVDFHSEVSMTVTTGNQSQSLEMKVDLNLQIARP